VTFFSFSKVAPIAVFSVFIFIFFLFVKNIFPYFFLVAWKLEPFKESFKNIFFFPFLPLFSLESLSIL